ncbi:MAG TPA: pilus assembly protein PilM [Candidatus Baltobacteraceae bacterium]|nr:pilus assembly protein PilM [Candidatus Baltobacteraceae bacterium]
MKQATLPLGIDIGATRIRVVEARQTARGARIRAVATRDISSGVASSGSLTDSAYIAVLIEEAVAELGTAQRRCVCAIGEPDALLRPLTLPNMTSIERERAARFEAQRFIEYPVDQAVIRLHPVDASAGLWALGIARSSAIVTRTAALRAAGLKLVAMDHEACALARALPGFDAIVDVGHQRSSLHLVTPQTPVTLQAYSGGADVTRAIERELSIDAHTAEKRKRILGTAGAGERARAALSADLAALIQNARTTQAVGRVALVGNAARLAGLAADLESATGALYEMAVSEALCGDDYPDDVIRTSAPDWTLAAGLALWSVN